MKAIMSGTAFNQLIGAVKAFTSKSNGRYNNQYIHIFFNAGNTNATAFTCDGYRAGQETVVCGAVDEDFDVLILPPQIKANKYGDVEIAQDEEYSYINYGDIQFRTKKPTGESFDVRGAISAEVAKKDRQVIGINADYMMDALRSLKLSGATIRKPVVMEITGPLSPILLRTDKDNYKMVLPVRIRTEQHNDD